jgi:hypothetical protein
MSAVMRWLANLKPRAARVNSTLGGLSPRTRRLLAETHEARR